MFQKYLLNEAIVVIVVVEVMVMAVEVAMVLAEATPEMRMAVS